MTNTTQVSISSNLVASVYSGKNNHCCCGCAGTYRYNPKYVAYSSKHRGYPVTKDEIGMRLVTKITRLMADHRSDVRQIADENSDHFHYTLELGNRLYMAIVPKV
jgi:hypothetical protein